MALAPEERKIATLLAAFEDAQARVDKAAKRFEQVGTLEPEVRQTIHQALGQKLAQLQSAIDELAQRGGRADLRTCGVGNTHLCVRGDTKLARYGEENDYFVVKGY